MDLVIRRNTDWSNPPFDLFSIDNPFSLLRNIQQIAVPVNRDWRLDELKTPLVKYYM